MTPFQSISIQSSKQVEFAAFWEIYHSSFPPEERKSVPTLDLALRNEKFTLRIYYYKDQPIGIMAYWHYSDFCYLEYLAVVTNQKGKGWGSRWLKMLMQTIEVPIILEIEHLVDSVAIRRKKFYERLGFVSNPSIVHFQPSYQHHLPPVPMLILSYPSEMSTEQYQHFNHLLNTEMIQLV